MRRLILAAPLLLAGCGGQSPDIIAAAARACQLIQPVLAGASMLDPRARVYIEYAQSICVPLQAGNPPATLDANTPLWLDGLAAALRALR